MWPVAMAVAVIACLGGGASSMKHCPPCGNWWVPYPLSTARDCGDQAYKVRCDGGALFLPTSKNSSSYPITSITPSIQRLTVRPAPLLRNACMASDGGLQLSPAAPFNITPGNTVFYFNCSPDVVTSTMNCTSNNLCHSYLRATPQASACVDPRATVCCTESTGGSTTSYSIQVRPDRCLAYTSFANLDPTRPVSQWGQPGVEIQWLPPMEPLCSTQADCHGVRARATSTCRPTDGGIKRCLCDSGLFWDSVNGTCAPTLCHDRAKCENPSKAPLISGLTCLAVLALVITASCIILCRRHRRIKEARKRLTWEREEVLNLNSSGGRAAKLFTSRELKRATKGFSPNRLLGVGGFGEVYKGKLGDGTVVAVKCAKAGNTKCVDQVLNEVRILCQVNHRSLVRLLGCCVEVEQPLMVYEYVPNGTLFEHLHGPVSPLTWPQRLSIAHQTALGLTYLHSSAVPPIYHRDVKSSNILLDHKLNAKVSDFGLSRLVETDMTHISTCAQGTLGYLDPEYYRNYQLTDKSDVYSFGVVLLELLTSMKAIDFSRDTDEVNLAVYVTKLVEQDRLIDAIDPTLKTNATPLVVDTMKALGFLAMACLEECRQSRPSMKEVTEEIEYIVSIAPPKEDFL